MNETKKFIGFDLGAESGRCIVAKLNGEKIVLDEIHRFNTHNYIKDNEFHWDIKKIFNEIITGLKKSAEKYGDDFEGIAVDTWGVDYTLIGSDNEALNNPFHYRDDRTDDIMDDVFKILSKEDLYSKTGIQNLQFNTIFQLYSEYNSTNSNISKAHKFLLIPDYLSFLLSGKINAEYSIASTTGLVDPETRDWNWEIVEKLNIDKKIFPEIVQSGTISGTLLPEISEQTGLKKTIPIIASAGHDTAAAVVSAPSKEENWAFLSSGTWSIMGKEINEPIINDLAMKYNFSNEGGIKGTVRFLKNIIGLWPVQECKRAWSKENKEYSYVELTKFADEYGEAAAWLDLDDPRFLKAGAMPEKIASFLTETNQPLEESAGNLIRVTLESLAFNYRIAIQEIQQIIGKKITVLNAIGGGTQNELLCQLTADALGIPVIAGPIEGTIIGNIGVQAMATNSVDDLCSWRRIVENSFELKTYLPENSGYFNKNETKFKSICNIKI